MGELQGVRYNGVPLEVGSEPTHSKEYTTRCFVGAAGKQGRALHLFDALTPNSAYPHPSIRRGARYFYSSLQLFGNYYRNNATSVSAIVYLPIGKADSWSQFQRESSSAVANSAAIADWSSSG